jgi:hypothetical protein
MDVERMTKQARELGASAADIAMMGLNQQEQDAKEGITVYRENWPVYQLFTACGTQWHTAGPGLGKHIIKTGLNYAAVEIRARHLPDTRALDDDATDQLWRDLHTLETAALEIWAELREAERT